MMIDVIYLSAFIVDIPYEIFDVVYESEHRNVYIYIEVRKNVKTNSRCPMVQKFSRYSNPDISSCYAIKVQKRQTGMIDS